MGSCLGLGDLRSVGCPAFRPGEPLLVAASGRGGDRTVLRRFPARVSAVRAACSNGSTRVVSPRWLPPPSNARHVGRWQSPEQRPATHRAHRLGEPHGRGTTSRASSLTKAGCSVLLAGTRDALSHDPTLSSRARFDRRRLDPRPRRRPMRAMTRWRREPRSKPRLAVPERGDRFGPLSLSLASSPESGLTLDSDPRRSKATRARTADAFTARTRGCSFRRYRRRSPRSRSPTDARPFRAALRRAGHLQLFISKRRMHFSALAMTPSTPGSSPHSPCGGATRRSTRSSGWSPKPRLASPGATFAGAEAIDARPAMPPVRVAWPGMTAPGYPGPAIRREDPALPGASERCRHEILSPRRRSMITVSRR